MKIQQRFGAAVLSLGLVVGLSGFAGATTGTIDTTGYQSNNTVTSDVEHRAEVRNDNNLNVENNNDQDADTGDAEVRATTTGGDAWTGDAANANAFTGMVEIDNSSDVATAPVAPVATHTDQAHISNTGANSNNQVRYEATHSVEVRNDNNINVVNDNTQNATSGDADVSHSTTGGSAVSGDAMNTNTTSLTFRVTN